MSLERSRKKYFQPDSSVLVVLPLLVGVLYGTVPEAALGQADTTGTQKLTLPGVVTTLLKQDPQIELQKKEIEANLGQLQSSTGEFDFRFTSEVQTAVQHDPVITGEEEPKFTTQYSVNLTKKFFQGTKLGPFAEVSRSNDHQRPLPVTARPQPVFTSRIGFRLVQPFLEGAGSSAVLAEYDSARHQVQASRHELHHTISSRLRRGINSYWNYLASRRRFKIRKKSESRTKELLEQTRTLIENDERPEAEIDQIRAQLSDKRSARINAHQRYLEARHQLGIDIGLPTEKIENLSPPSGDFPEPVNDADVLRSQAREFLQLALKERKDYRAAKNRVRSRRRLVEQAEDRTQQNLDLNLEASYRGLEQGRDQDELYWDSVHRNRTDLNLDATISFEWPVQNNRALGTLKRRKAQYRRALINRKDLWRQIQSDVRVALEDLRSQYRALRETHQSVQSYEKALDNERKKYKLGSTTIIDLINTEDRLTDAYISLVQSKRRYARSLIDVRFQTGQLYLSEERSGVLSTDRILSIPTPPEDRNSSESNSKQ